ncbi:uncharacterized protein I206_103830 [Kwoniella pini CBS 10737]|uniref:Multidrug transporter n=1 Tax=Kwoniella pini CBS 10737 TaxID=1296096 RepID=A0A1B9HSP5_9TREE|nr:multidrug transporter [Kwoniella pini CBS 10737]OCF46302.1 multidrug transporter [Kwoniella pini CBS 10737]
MAYPETPLSFSSTSTLSVHDVITNNLDQENLKKPSEDENLLNPNSIISNTEAKDKPNELIRVVTKSLPTQSSINSSSTKQSSILQQQNINQNIQFSYYGKGTISNPYIIDFKNNEDKINPYNWKKSYKWILTLIIGITSLCPPFASVSYSSTVIEIGPIYGMSRELSTAGISLFILGFALGPLIWAPISEIWGRNFAFYASFPAFTLFNLGTALSNNTQTLLIMRFLAGFGGSSTLTNAGGQIGDMWAAHERAMATSVFSLAPFLGPVLGPIVGGYVTQTCGYRWVYWIQFIYASVVTVISIVFIPETYAPTILRREAAKLTKSSREEGKNEVYIAKYDQTKKTKAEIIKIGLWRPFELLFTEVIVGCLAIYGAIIYGILYLFFACFPLIYQETRGWTVGQGGLAFLGMGFGLILGNILNPLGNYWYRKASIPGKTTPPESRLPLACISAILFPIGLIWFAWTSAPPIHWIWSILACIPFGIGFFWMFNSVVNYIIDSYTLYSASALASLAVLRCLFGAAFPLFAVNMYRNLGLHIAGTIVAILAIICAPLPFLFYRYGPYLRRKSRYAPSQQHKIDEEHLDTSIQSQEEIRDTSTRVKMRPDESLEPECEVHDGGNTGEGGLASRDLEKK